MKILTKLKKNLGQTSRGHYSANIDPQNTKKGAKRIYGSSPIDWRIVCEIWIIIRRFRHFPSAQDRNSLDEKCPSKYIFFKKV